jgi:hypothetical protein
MPGAVGPCMMDEGRRAREARAAEPAHDDAFGLGSAMGEEVTTGIVVAAAVAIVALIAVLMGMA